MRLKEYYNKNIEGLEKTNENEWNIIADYLSSFEMNEQDLKFMHSLDYNAVDFLDTDGTEDEFYINNDLFLLIDYFYDVYGFMFTSKIRNYTKEDLQDKLKMFKRCTHVLSRIIEKYAD